MADKKISALASASLPLAGTEVFPIVQSATTVKVSVAGMLAAPPSIGATTPAAGSFTTLNARNSSNTVPALIVAGLQSANGIIQFGSTGGVYQISGGDYQGNLGLYSAGGVIFNTAGVNRAAVNATGLTVYGIVVPDTDNTRTLGTAAARWSTVYAGTGTINTSDAREKTAVSSFTAAELNAAKQLSKEIGTYKFLDSVKNKGDAARTHIGLTVQRAIEIMQAHNLNPFDYGFICYDVWDNVFVEHPATKSKAAWMEQTQIAGSRFAFRYDQLNLFIAAGFEARLAALEFK